MAKKSTKKQLGVRQVASLISSRYTKKYIQAKYPKFNTPTKLAKKIVVDLKKEGKNVNITNTLGGVRVKRVPKITVELSSVLLSPTAYFDIDEVYSNEIPLTDHTIWFTSKLWGEGVAVQGGQTLDYEKYFSDFVSYIDKQRKDNEDKTAYEQEWYIICKEPTLNRTTGRWESEIMSCDSEGNYFDYGYSPTGAHEEIELPEKPTEEPKKEEPIKPEIKYDIEKEREKTRRIEFKEQQKTKRVIAKEKTKQSSAKAIVELSKLYSKGLITKKEFLSLTKKIK